MELIESIYWVGPGFVPTLAALEIGSRIVPLKRLGLLGKKRYIGEKTLTGSGQSKGTSLLSLIVKRKSKGGRRK